MMQVGTRLLVKSVFDRGVAAFALVATAPLLAGSVLAVAIGIGCPVFFRQERPGRGGRPFRIFKLRTMIDARGPDGELLPDEQRLVKVGAFLRRWSLDELPQLINVVLGDLSLVGPRPLLMRYLPRYSATQRRRHEVMPGITGWAQINGRNAISWDEKLALDVWYVDNWSLGLDLKILLQTVTSVLRRDGISNEGHATMPEFMGSNHTGEL